MGNSFGKVSRVRQCTGRVIEVVGKQAFVQMLFKAYFAFKLISEQDSLGTFVAELLLALAFCGLKIDSSGGGGLLA